LQFGNPTCLSSQAGGQVLRNHVHSGYSIPDRRTAVEFPMGYYGILDRTPKGRNEGDAFQVWIRRHNEY
jgi:predicted dithiol-disulfide oxidoreductase (DUF899 family)